MLISKLFRVATEGDTTDGRAITRQQIDQMAKNYDPKKYGARIWMEHLRGYLPDGSFRAFGDVVEVKASDVDGKRTLFARLAPTPDLVAINQNRQKIYSSIEIDTNFAKSGEAYLVGLGVTDSPASLGTDVLEFCANAGDKNFLNSRKQRPENLFSASHEADLEFVEEAEPTAELEGGQKFMDRIKDFLKGNSDQQKVDFNASLVGITGAIEAIAQAQREVLEKFAANGNQAPDLKKLQDSVDALGTDIKKQETEFAAFRKEVEETADPKNPTRPAATGGDVIKTDC